ncbi:PP2C family protein-serine/threonine phosphatase [Streptomyces sp. enrichment culture]|uniref:PP2C family protein-serine/threonine phosphatase n=1 Tax=Streptomyces sp. enrichment culture TaxID=1795815 RepID=UPI003F578871
MPYTAVTALSHPGLIRDHNEDSLVVGPWTLCGTVTDSPQTLAFPRGRPLLAAVADGLGGHPGGEVASGLVVNRLAGLGPSLTGAQEVGRALEVCNRELFEAGEDHPELATMGTTVAGVLVLTDSLLSFNIGDSKVYRQDGEGLRQISVDDSPPPLPGRRTTSAVTQTLGGSAGFTPVTPHLAPCPLTPGDRYLVCSDGLTDPVPDDDLALLLEEPEDGRAAFALWRAAIEAGGPDNITLALIRVHD